MPNYLMHAVFIHERLSFFEILYDMQTQFDLTCLSVHIVHVTTREAINVLFKDWSRPLISIILDIT